MRQLLMLTAILSIAPFGFAQKKFDVFDNYTQNPYERFTVSGSSEKVTYKVDAFTVSCKIPKSEYLVISAEGFLNDTVRPGDKAEEIYLQLDDTMSKECWKEYFPKLAKADYSNVVEVFDTPAEYPGGVQEMRKFLANNLMYPQVALVRNIEGRSYIRFIIEADGSTSNYSFTRCGIKALDEEAIRVVMLMNKWVPATVDGNPVRTIFTFPVSFKLQ